MAILPGLSGIEVGVLVNGIPAREYPNLDDTGVSPTTVTKYIQSEDGKKFSIHLRVEDPYKFDEDCGTLGFKVFVDSCCVRKPYLRKEKYEGEYKRAWKQEVIGTKVADGIRAFKFVPIKMTESDDAALTMLDDEISISKIGQIVVRLYRESDAVLADGSKFRRETLDPKDHAVHEMALKGESKSHGAALGEVTKVEGLETVLYKTTKLDGVDSPLAEFRFAYRSRAALKSLLVIPQSPDPSEVPVTPKRRGRPPKKVVSGKKSDLVSVAIPVAEAAELDKYANLTSAQKKQVNELLASFSGKSSGRRAKRVANGDMEVDTPTKRQRTTNAERSERTNNNPKNKIVDVVDLSLED